MKYGEWIDRKYGGGCVMRLPHGLWLAVDWESGTKEKGSVYDGGYKASFGGDIATTLKARFGSVPEAKAAVEKAAKKYFAQSIGMLPT